MLTRCDEDGLESRLQAWDIASEKCLLHPNAELMLGCKRTDGARTLMLSILQV